MVIYVMLLVWISSILKLSYSIHNDQIHITLSVVQDIGKDNDHDWNKFEFVTEMLAIFKNNKNWATYALDWLSS
jgi:hypothetical protein